MKRELKVYEKLQDWRDFRQGDLAVEVATGKRLGIVPTMGALHAGHAALLQQARKDCDFVVLSIFVNPTQFNNPDDLIHYPKTLEHDLKIARDAGVDFVLLPNSEQIYTDGYRYKVSESEFSARLCGAHRPGHFDGVLTVVMKLFNLVGPRLAYFGEKDFQQLQLIREMAAAFFMELEIVPCPTVREADGLAMSSRNVRLSTDARERARLFPQLLQSTLSPEEIRAELEESGFQVDYIEDHGERRFGAVHIGGVRLIDNMKRGQHG